MLPIVLNGGVAVGVAGKGDGLVRRLAVLEKAGIAPAKRFDDTVAAQDLSGLQILFVAGLDADAAEAIAKTAREEGVLINVEDVPSLCDFHVPAQIRRGDLLLTVSTSGRAPGLSRILRETIEADFGPEWESRLEELASARAGWRAEGLRPEEVSARTRALLGARGWLS